MTAVGAAAGPGPRPAPVAAAAPASAPTAREAAVEPFWAEEFSGRSGRRPDARVWTSEVGNRRQQGWWNNELQYYTRVDVRARLPTGRGLLPAIWMLGDNGRTWPRQGEIDVVEVVGGEPRTAYGTAHGPGYANEDGLGGTVGLGGRASARFHLYSVVKEPRRITWLVDDEPYFTLTPQDLPAGRAWVFEQDMHLLLNVAVGGDWPGRPGRATRFPATMAVDHVRMYGTGVVDGVRVTSPR
ncbi:glycoside hydrolase family 16 protein [Nocardioides dongxiaopingii]|nr:glycoside hydrolase family 16 protein [Nocardioides sp. S-1144]